MHNHSFARNQKSDVNAQIRREIKNATAELRRSSGGHVRFSYLIEYVHRRTKLLRPTRTGNAAVATTAKFAITRLKHFANHQSWWIRPIQSWHPTETNPRLILRELAHHLFAEYPVPHFLDSVWDWDAHDQFLFLKSAPFGYCSALTNIAVDPLNPAYASLDGVLFDKAQKALIQYPIAKFRSFYTIPDTVIRVGDLAFAGCVGLTEVTIPNRVTSIGVYAFQETGLVRVKIPDSVTTLEGAAFRACQRLTSVTIGNGVSTIMDDTFSDCPRLTTVTMGNSVSVILQYAFLACPAIRSVHFLGNAPGDVGQFGASIDGTVFYRAGTTGWGSDFGGRPTMLWVATDDLDQDGLSNEKEMLWGTDPLRADGISDFIVASSAEKAGYRLRLSIPLNIPDGIATAMAVAGNYLYVSTAAPGGEASYIPGIHVFDVADPNNPVWKTTLRSIQHFGQYGAPLLVEGNVLYSFDREKVSLIDITDPKSPRLVSQWSPQPGIPISRIAAKGNFLYVLDAYTLTIVNVANPALPAVLGEWRSDLPNNYGHMEIARSHAFIPEAGILQIVDVSNPAAPRLVKSYTREPESTPIGPMAFKNSLAYIVTRYDTADWRIDVLDITNPAEPLLVTSLPYGSNGSTIRSMNIVNDRLYLRRHESLMPGEHDFLGITDIRDPNRPVLVGEFGSRNYSTPSFHSMAANEKSIFLGAGSTILVYEPQIFPSLGITSSGNQIELNWPNVDPAFRLQQKSNIDSSSPWTDILSPPNLNEGQTYLTVPADGNLNFFRLEKQ